MKSTILSLFVLLGIIFCPAEAFSFAKHPGKMKEIAIGTYAVGESIDQSRLDLAEKYNDGVKKLVPAPKPKDRIKIEGIDKITKGADGKSVRERVIIVPAKLDPKLVVRKDSEEFQELLKAKESLAAYQEGEKQWIKYSEKVEDARRNEEVRVYGLEKDIVKKEKKITELSKYKSIVFSVVALIGVLIAVYVISLFLRLAMAGARLFS